MNIKKIINLILIISLTVININSSGDKKRKFSYDDSDLVAKKIKLDEAVLIKLAKEKKDLADKKNKEAQDKAQVANQEQNKSLCCAGLLEKFSQETQQSVNLSCTGLPTAVTKIISQYLEWDWYLYSGRDFIYNNYEGGKLIEYEIYKIKKICFSADNKLMSIIGDIEKETEIIELHKIFNLDTKRFKKSNFIRLLQKTVFSKEPKKLNIIEDVFGQYNNITFSRYPALNKIFTFNKEYFPMDIIQNGRFSLSFDEKYVAYACVDFFIIWVGNKFLHNELKRENVLKKYSLNPKNEYRSDSWINCLSFSPCGNYLAINVYLDDENSLSFIYNLANDTLLDLTGRPGDLVSTLAFSHDSRYLVLGGPGSLRIFKRGFE